MAAVFSRDSRPVTRAGAGYRPTSGRFFPRKFRRRLVAAFVLVAAGSAAVASLISWGIVNRYRTKNFRQDAIAESQLNLAYLPLRPTGDDITRTLAYYHGRPVTSTIVVLHGRLFESDPSVTAGRLPTNLANVAGTNLGTARQTIHGVPYLVVGGARPSSDASLYFFFSMRPLQAGLRDMRNSLLLADALVVLVAALFGTSVSKRVLRPVRASGDAAKALAEGILDTRLAVGGDDEFGALALSFNEMADALQDKIAALQTARDRERRIASDLAHELRTPLGSILGAASLLADSELPHEQDRRLVDIVAGEARRLTALVNAALLLARMDAGVEEIQWADVDIADVVRHVIARVDVDGKVALDATSAPTVTDTDRVALIVENLISNALRYGQRDIKCTVAAEDEEVVICVSDRGPGIGPEHIDKIFQRFYRTDTARTGGSSGLGLAVALENARLLGGTIDASDQPGGGAVFVVRLPQRGAAGSRQRGEAASSKRSG